MVIYEFDKLCLLIYFSCSPFCLMHTLFISFIQAKCRNISHDIFTSDENYILIAHGCTILLWLGVRKYICFQAIRRTVDKKTVDVYFMFNDELNAVKKELTQRSFQLSPTHPKFSGQALWARMLKRRIEINMMVCIIFTY